MAGTPSAFERRTDRCQERLAAAGIDGVVLFPSSNLYYLSGFREEPMERHLFLIVTPEATAFVAPSMYEDQLRAESWIEPIHPWADGEDPMATVEPVLEDLGLGGGRVLLDDRMWALFTEDLRAALPDATFGLASEVFADLRMRKDDRELEHLRAAGRISDAVCTEIRRLGADAVGLTERELVEELRSRLEDRGGEGFSFDPIVGSGPNGARPHHRHGDRTIRPGDPVVLDFGTTVAGYPGDQTRTVVFDGAPPEGFEAVHETVLAAHEAGVNAVEPGVEARTVDRAARAVIEDAGYGDAFIHRTGHGVGLEVHEPPYIAADNDLELEPGMVFSVEPGIYLEGEFGVRIEDLVVVTEDGHERLNDSPRGWNPEAV